MPIQLSKESALEMAVLNMQQIVTNLDEFLHDSENPRVGFREALSGLGETLHILKGDHETVLAAQSQFEDLCRQEKQKENVTAQQLTNLSHVIENEIRVLIS